MFFKTTLLALLAASALAAPVAEPELEKRQLDNVQAVNTNSYNNTDLIAKLITVPLQEDRVALLQDADFKFDFRNPPGNVAVALGTAGRTVAANRRTMPALIGTGSGMTMGFLGPCGFNTPHTHPRATELNVPVQGQLTVSMILENGVRVVHNNVTTYQLHVFPQGAVHQEFNPDCTETVFVAGFNNEDFGTSQTADNFFRLKDDVIVAALGGNVVVDGRDLDQFKGMIPHNVAIGVEACLKKCNLGKR